MAANKEVIVNIEGSTLTLSREFDAPRNLVFKPILIASTSPAGGRRPAGH
jgi:hypothetical protein